jgi:uncharacterized SAM-dependent methyltransferase
MHLVSRRDQSVLVDGVPIPFVRGESILTECSYKYSVEAFAALASQAGFTLTRVWSDPQQLFSAQYLVVDSTAISR